MSWPRADRTTAWSHPAPVRPIPTSPPRPWDRLFQHARYFGEVRIAVLSGAGISAESGRPHLRDDKTGLWARFRPLRAIEHRRLAAPPRTGVGLVPVATSPGAAGSTNDGHHARRRGATRSGRRGSVITQNVDNLRTGGQYRRAPSARQPVRLPLRPVRAAVHRPAAGPSVRTGWRSTRRSAAALIRPDIIMVSARRVRRPVELRRRRGAANRPAGGRRHQRSFYPAAGLPELALAQGTVVVEVNPEPTPLSPATVTMRESASNGVARSAAPAAGPVGLISGRFEPRPSANSATGNGSQRGSVH